MPLEAPFQFERVLFPSAFDPFSTVVHEAVVTHRGVVKDVSVSPTRSSPNIRPSFIPEDNPPVGGQARFVGVKNLAISEDRAAQGWKLLRDHYNDWHAAAPDGKRDDDKVLAEYAAANVGIVVRTYAASKGKDPSELSKDERDAARKSTALPPEHRAKALRDAARKEDVVNAWKKWCEFFNLCHDPRNRPRVARKEFPRHMLPPGVIHLQDEAAKILADGEWSSDE